MRFAGFGGQGLVFASIVLAKAAAVHGRSQAFQSDTKLEKSIDHRFAVQTQSYGPESRGGASKADVKLSDEENPFPFVEFADILVAMSQPGLDRYAGSVARNGTTIIDPELVKRPPAGRVIAVPATATAARLGNRKVANMVMVGAVCALSKAIPLDAVDAAVAEMVPPESTEVNRRAVREGWEAGRKEF